MTSETLVLIRAEGDSAGYEAWTVVPCPWPGLPIAHGADSPGSDRMSWRCCNAGAVGLIAEVIVHLPAPGQVAFTVRVGVDNPTIEHLIDAHGFTRGDLDVCAPARGYHASPHQGCILRTV